MEYKKNKTHCKDKLKVFCKFSDQKNMRYHEEVASTLDIHSMLL